MLFGARFSQIRFIFELEIGSYSVVHFRSHLVAETGDAILEKFLRKGKNIHPSMFSDLGVASVQEIILS